MTELLALRVARGEWDDGRALPSEPELAEALGVARTSVREALSRLKAKGLLVSRTRSGTKVLPRPQWNMLDEDVLRWTWSTQDQLVVAQQLMQLCRIVEPEAAAIAAATANDNDIAAIERAYRLMDAAGMDSVAFAGSDLDFHRAILVATGNPYLVALANGIRAALMLSFDMSSHQAGAPRRSLPLHRDVLDAIWARKPDAARAAMQTLLGVTEGKLHRGARARAAAEPGEG